MRARALAAATFAAISAALLVCSACSTPVSTPAPGPAASAAAASASASASTPPTELRGIEYTENDFVESDRNRDPFRSYLVQSQPVNKQALNQRKIALSQYSLDELKLVAIVTGGDQARAMFVDPSGKGTVVYKGSFVCRPEVVHIGGSNGPEYQLNWRVDRIRTGDVVLIREDPAQPAIPPATRVIPLHPETEKQAAAEGLLPG
jgi:type IV pilus assembly protein PilP